MERTLPKAQIGVLGLGTMGESLALNMAGKGLPVAVYNRTAEKTMEFMRRVDKSMTVVPTYSLAEFSGALETPRKVLLMVTAGPAVDQVIKQVSPLLSKGDILIDAGNSFFGDTERREKETSEVGLRFLGVGVSGGEEGALKGPCVMVGGPKEAYAQVEAIFGKMAARTPSGVCSAYLGPGGAGHFTKMVHNGVEYALMELIAEAYDLQVTGLGLEAGAVRDNFAVWNSHELQSYLMEIAVQALSKTDEDTGRPLVEMILDRAQQKGTGKWTSQTALDLGVPIPTIDAGVSARNLSAYKDERVRASKMYPSARIAYRGDTSDICEELGDALHCSFIASFAQGFSLLKAGSKEYRYALPLDEIARIWKGGCIIRAKLLDRIQAAFAAEPSLDNLMVDSGLESVLRRSEGNWRHVVQVMKSLSIPAPAMDSALDYYDSYRREKLPANLIQALRDIFGAHTYERIDKAGSYHTDWA
jgi:6-phosphogluconate dehydrogenase